MASKLEKPAVGSVWINPRGRQYEVVGHTSEVHKIIVRDLGRGLDRGLCDVAQWELMTEANGWRQAEQRTPEARTWPEMPAWATEGDDDRPLHEDAAILAAFPTRSGRHDLYGEAMRLVGARRSKGGLVELVNWLLHRCEQRPETALPPRDIRCHECGEMMTDHVMVTRHAKGKCEESFVGPLPGTSRPAPWSTEVVQAKVTAAMNEWAVEVATAWMQAHADGEGPSYRDLGKLLATAYVDGLRATPTGSNADG